MMRFRNEGFKTSGKDNRYGILQKNLKLTLEETAMKSLFEQMGGTYTLQGDYYLPNVTLGYIRKTQIRTSDGMDRQDERTA